MVWVAAVMVATTMHAQQLTNANFEDWSGAAFDGNIQPKGWNASNVTQFGFKFNFAHRETGHNGGYCMMVQDQEVGAAGITETSPGYFSLGQPWVYISSLTAVSQASAGTYGGINWTHRPDSMSVWIKRTGSNTSKEDFYLLYYSWTGNVSNNRFKGKNGSCTTTDSYTNEESDIRQAMDGNECGTPQGATQISEGMWRERATYNNWINIRVPIYYMNNSTPQKMNIIFSASNYPNFRANNGLYTGNSLYVDDAELIYSSKIQKLYINDKEWKGFDPNNTGVQEYALGETATAIPSIEARRGAGSLTNARGTTKSFVGRVLSGSEITITNGNLTDQPTLITVRSEDGSSTTTYKIQFKKAKSSNTKLAGIAYVLGSDTISVPGFSPTKYAYNVTLPFGTTTVPQVVADKQEEAQNITYTQPTSTGGTATIRVTAANGTDTQDYTLSFSVGALADNTLKDIKVNGSSIPGFTPSQNVYKVSLPVGTPSLTIEPVSKPEYGNLQTVVITPSPLPAGEAIHGSAVQLAVTTPGNPIANTYKLNLKLEQSSYSYLKSLQVGEYITSFEPDNFIYYINLPMGTTAIPAITYTRGDEYQTVTVSELGEGVVDGTVRVTVTAGNGDVSVYKLVFNTEKSENSTLAGIKIDGVLIPDFSPEKTSYTDTLPVGTTTVPVIEAVPADEFQQIAITMPTSVNGKARITVTAGNGNTTVYQIAFYVNAYTDNTLADLSVEGYSLQDSEGVAVSYDPAVTEYWVNLPQGTTALPAVTYTPQAAEPLQYVVPRPVTSGLNGDYKITVRPQNGASNTYIIHFSVATSSVADLAMIYLDKQPLEGFHKDTLHYIDSLPIGVSKIPTVTYDKMEPAQRVLSVLEGKTQIITVTAQDGKTKKVYSIHFVIQTSANAYLQMIYLDGTPLPGFVSQKTDGYVYQLQGETCPKITVDKEEGQQVTITAPYGEGTAQIKVAVNGVVGNTYEIQFIKVAPQTTRLDSILINGELIAGYRPDSMYYEASYQTRRPEITVVKQHPSQQVNIAWKEEVAWIQVQDTLGNKASYSIAFTRTYSSDSDLAAIYANGLLIEGFDPTEKTYNKVLAPGSKYPEISYALKDEQTQSAVFGKIGDGQWKITVFAENGASADYFVTYTIEKYSDATLQGLSVEGKTLTPAFEPNTFAYAVTIDEGDTLPQVLPEAREGQTVVFFNLNDSTQQVIVYAESGANHTYTIAYDRVPSNNALLADILIDGVSLEGFGPTITHYVDSLDKKDKDGHPIKVVPNVFPIGGNAKQTITTYFSRIDGETKIHVEAQDGTINDYFIAFPVRKSANSFLGDLMLDSEDAEIKFKPSQTEYEVELPYETAACPKLILEKAEPEQRIDIISRPIGDTTQVIVTAENGDTRTYSILFKREVLNTRNLLSMIRIKELDQELSLKNKDQRDFNVEMPFGSRSLTIEYEKSYEEQTVFIQPGGVKAPTIITVKANNDTVADEVYRIIPSVPTADPAVLTDIKINGTTITGFEREHFSYIVKVTDKPILRYTLNKGAEINILEQTSKHWKAEVTYGERTNTYDVWYYYQNDVVPNMDFQSWENARATTSARKPTGWNVLADFAEPYEYKPLLVTYTFTPGEEVQQDGSNSVAYLHTQYNEAPLAGYIPGYMTLGNIEYHYQRWGSSAFSISGGMTFRNTPDEMSYRIKVDQVNNNARVLYTLNGSGGEETLLREEAKTSGYVTRTMDLTPANAVAEEPTQLNITFNSFDSESGKNGTVGGEAKMYVDWLTLSFNHTLTSMKVNGLAASKSGNAFEVTLDNSEYIEKPILSFTGEVRDQAQDVVWKDTTFDADFETRTADIRNWAENGADYSDYTLTVKRPLDTLNQLASLYKDSLPITGFDPAVTSYTIHVPAARRHLHDLIPVPASSRQTVATAYNETDSTMTITVTPEKGEAMVYTVKFVTDRSNDTTLTDIVAEGVTFDAETREYVIEKEQLPLITFVKKSDLQTVSLINGVITVTAENGAVGTYTIKAQAPVVPSTGVLSSFYHGDNIQYDGIGGTDLEKEADKPQTYVAFTRAVASDSVVFLQDPAKMQWAATGSEGSTTYTWTYPTSLSSDTTLANIKLDGLDYEEFNIAEDKYEILSDTTLFVEPIGQEGQTLVTTFAEENGVVTYTTVVTAANGDAKRTYKIKVARPKSSSPYLAGLMLDTTMVADFDSLQFNYTVTLPVEAVKRENPKMPSITYIAGHEGQTIEVDPGQLNGNPTVFTVHSEEDASIFQIYTLTVNSEKSHCSDLTGISVNGEALDYFEPGRHFYSVSLKSDQYEVDYTSDDRFQEVTRRLDTIHKTRTDTMINQIRYTLHVEAENGGADTSNYEVMIYFENQSNDAQLANITLDGGSFENFERALNADLTFDPGNNNYIINLPYEREVLPEVSAQLKMDGQQVEIYHRQDSVILDVTAIDGKTHNLYNLHFQRPLSKNAELSMIYINGDSLMSFDPSTYFYHVNLAVGVHTLPEVDGQKAEVGQTILSTIVDTEKRQATIKVLAQDQTYTATYVVAFQFTQSDVDTLAMIYQDGDALKNYRADSIYYAVSLPVGTTAFPDLSWEPGDEWQTITMSRLDSTSNSLIRQINVTSESMRTRTYTVSYMIEKSDIDTLQMIFVQQRRIENFEGTNNEYTFELTASEASDLNGRMPVVEYITGDDYQTVFVSQQPEETLTGKTLGYKSLVTVTAASGATRTYTIHYPVQKSDEATLNMINVGGKPLSNFVSEQYNYKQEIDVNAAVPVVTVIKKEEIQVVEISINEDTVSVLVTAEDGITTASYSLIFERVMSSITTLQRIILINQAGDTLPSYQFPFIPEERKYTVNVPYEAGKPLTEQLPNIETVLYDPLQVTEVNNHELDDANVRVSVTVIAPNGEDEGQYEITFHFIKSSDANLTSILVKGTELEGFSASNTEYNYAHPYGSSEADYFTAEDVQAILSDPLATATITGNENGKIFITVVAQDGTENTYTITQSIAKDNDCFLSAILLEDEGRTDTISGFDPEVTFYTYYLRAGATTTPNVDAIARSLNAVVDILPASAGDTCLIICTADDQTEKRYYIYFAISTIDESAAATASDVIVKRVPGAAQIFVGTLRKDVHFALFDEAGRLLFYEQVPTADPNEVEIGIGEDGHERLNNITGTTYGLTIDIELGRVYFYTILYGDKNFIQMIKGDTAKRLRYGKFIAL